MSSNTRGQQQPNRRGTIILFGVLLVMGLAILGLRMLEFVSFSDGTMIGPIVGGLIMAVVIAVIVRRDRNQRNTLPTSRKDRQDQGVPY